MDNFMCQLDGATGGPALRLNIISVYLGECFWTRLVFELVNRVMQTVFPMWVGII